MATTNMRIVIRRDTSTNWNNVGASVTLLAGEQGYETDTGKMKIGNGDDVWNNLPYYTGGITDIDHDTIVMDAAGVIRLNSESVIGEIGTDTIKEYVDLKDTALSVRIDEEAAARAAADSVEAAARAAEDSALGARIDEEFVSRSEADLRIQEAIGGIGDRVVVLESVSATKDELSASNDSIEALDIKLDNVKNESNAADVAINIRIDTLEGALSDSVDALEAADQAESDRVDALIASDMWLFADQAAFPPAADNHGRVVHSHAAGAMFYAHGGAWHELAQDAKFGTMTGPDGTVSATVTDFVGLVTGNLGGVNVQTYSDAGDSALGAQISDLQDMDTTLGSQINERVAADAVQDGRLDALEADSVTATELADAVSALEELIQLSLLHVLDADAILQGNIDATDY